MAAAPVAIAFGAFVLAASSTLAVLLGLPLIALASIWLVGSVATRRLEPPEGSHQP